MSGPRGAGGEKRVVILGALSAIAIAMARLYAAGGGRILLAGRGSERLAALAADLRARGARQVETADLDLAAAAHEADTRMREFEQQLGGLDHVHVVYGRLGSGQDAETDATALADILTINFTSAALWCAAAAARMRKAGRGVVLAIGSVAGDRGRASNYPYGAAKGGLALFMQGLAHSLAGTGARAVAIRLGFVVTPMTEGMKRSGPLWRRPEDVAPLILRATETGGPIQYVPGFWRLIMLIIRLVPSFVMHRTRL